MLFAIIMAHSLVSVNISWPTVTARSSVADFLASSLLWRLVQLKFGANKDFFCRILQISHWCRIKECLGIWNLLQTKLFKKFLIWTTFQNTEEANHSTLRSFGLSLLAMKYSLVTIDNKISDTFWKGRPPWKSLHRANPALEPLFVLLSM